MTNNLKGKDSPVKFLAILGLLIVAGFGYVRYFPTFLDAPLGIKHCAAKEEVEAAKIVIQDRFDSCTK